MATASIQISNLRPSLAIYGEPNVFNRGSTKTVGMHRVQHPSVSSSIIKCFSGLHGHNSIDSHNRSQSRYLEIPNSTSRRREGVNEMVFPKAMFERFNVEAYKVIMRAQEEARRLGHNFVGTEHILLGLINECFIVDEVLTCVTLSDARFEVEKLVIGEGSGFVDVDIYFTQRAERLVSGLSLEEAQELGHNYVGPEHLLLGILREGEQSVGARVLENLGVDLSKIRKQVIKKLSGD